MLMNTPHSKAQPQVQETGNSVDVFSPIPFLVLLECHQTADEMVLVHVVDTLLGLH